MGFTKRSLTLGLMLALIPALALLASAGGGEEEDTAAGGAMTDSMFSESPMLSEMVAAGMIPPIDERIPGDPSVIFTYEMPDGIGKYGGNLTFFAPAAGGYPLDFLSNPALLRKDKFGDVFPDVAADIDYAADHMSSVIHLREGIRWSDGDLMDADDVLFGFNDLQLHPDVKTWQGFQHSGATKIDQFTVQIGYLQPYPTAQDKFATLNGSNEVLQPNHYLQKWHIDYNDDANDVAQEEGFDFWYEALRHHFWWNPLADAEKPTLGAYVFTQLDSTYQGYDRNPYFSWVDEAGQQLPYIDTVSKQIIDAEVGNLKIISGEADIAWTFTSFDNFTLYKENEAAGGYTVHQLPGPNFSEVTVSFNQSYSDPFWARLYRIDEFRQALSVAIDREEINDVVYKGRGIPRQATMGIGYDWVKPEWETAWAQYDPALANRMLDEIGLDKKNDDGIRLDDDGNPIQILVNYPAQHTQAAAVSVYELIAEYWNDVGFEVLTKAVESTLFWTLESGLGFGLGESIHNFYVHKFSRPWNSYLNAEYQVSIGAKSLDDFTDGKLPGEEPPDWVRDYWPISIFENRDTLALSDEWIAGATKLLDIQAEKLLIIGTVGHVPHLVTAKNELRNVPDVFPALYAWPGALDYYGPRLWWDR